MIPIIIIVVVIVVIVLIIIVITTTTTTTTIIIIIIIRGLDPGSPHRQPQRRVPRRGRWQFSSAWEQGICLVGNGGMRWLLLAIVDHSHIPYVLHQLSNWKFEAATIGFGEQKSGFEDRTHKFLGMRGTENDDLWGF